MDGHVILHDTSGSFLLLQNPKSEHDFPHLLFLSIPGSFDSLARRVYFQITGKHSDPTRDPPLTVRYYIQTDDDNDPVLAHIIEPVGPQCTIQLTADYSWAKIDSDLMKRMEHRYSPLIVEAINNIASETSDDSSCYSVPWFARGGCGKRLREDIRSRLKLFGYRDIDVVQRYSSPSSMIFAIEADETFVYYKISVCGAPEALFTQTLARLLPDHVVTPFGVDFTDNSFFTKSFGQTMAEALPHFDDERQRERLIKASINTIAEFHEKASKHVEELKALGMEDTSPQQMRSELPQFICELQDRGILKKEYAQKMRKLIPLIVSKLDVLANGNIPLTVCHGDLHEGNLTEPLADDEVPLLFDWYESSISHPFLDFVAYDFGYPPWDEIYAEKWRRYDSSEEIFYMLEFAGRLSPLWKIFRRLKALIKRGHQLGMKEDWDYCRVIMTRFIEEFLDEKST